LRFIVTRPEADARAVAQRLESAGHEVVKAPLMAIARRPGVIPQRRYRAVLITSANGARALADHPDRQRLAGAEAHAVGPASAAAMRAAGWGAGAVHQAPGDVAGLIAAVQAHLQPAEGPLLHVSGETVTGDLEGALARSGFAVDRVVLYAAEPARALPPTAARALTTGWADAVLLYSPRTAAEILRHLCLSEAVAKRIRAAFPEAPVAIAARPEEDAMAALALMTAAAGR
jgi:uroporphyrinogen-III synthase